MKKKQLAKLKQQFRPSYEMARQQLFSAIQHKTAANFGLETTVYINPKNREEMLIELQTATTKEQKITVPLDENFKIVVKRIQKQEKGLLDRFSDNLVEEIAAYWLPATSAVNQPEASATEPVSESQTEAAETTAGFAAFEEKMTAFPKFSVERNAEKVQIFEDTAKEKRLLATISATEVGEFTVEPALARKYKLKLDVIPLIEEYANTPLTER
ncbi:MULTISPECIES: hypothetical protein [Enterococcus]|uniref:hypothetical protein n=1 Tax=Enterococcus TaxID=1350 RepID=UPI0010FF93D3|nr:MULTISPECIES: hypothetical protein [Enterococcus]QCT92185.1 hypothetical protein FE005_09695 [Enterococcus sp. M190262]GMG58914.1 hypothetical protein AH4_23110 [Enterococcus gallinarum]